MKIPLEVFVIWNAGDHWNEPKFEAWSCNVANSNPMYALANKVTVDVDIPDDFDPVPQRIETLRAAQKNVRAEMEVKLNNIEDQIHRLLSIEYKPEAEQS